MKNTTTTNGPGREPDADALVALRQIADSNSDLDAAERDWCRTAADLIEQQARELAAARECIAACEERISEWCNYCGGNRTTCDNAPGQCPARDARAVIKETP